MQVLYLGRAPRTKETLPDFREKCRVTRHSRVFRGLTGSQWTPGFWGVTSATKFDGRMDPNAFSDWLVSIVEYFYWYEMIDSKRIRFAKMKLTNSVKMYW